MILKNHDFSSSSVPSESPPNTVVTPSSSRTIRVSWAPINQAYVHGILLGYEVRYAKDNGSPMIWKNQAFDAKTRQILLDDLAAFTRYRVVVCAKTFKGCGKKYTDVVQTWDDGELFDTMRRQ